MIKNFKFLISILAVITLVSCSKNDTPGVTPKRPYPEQYSKDIDTIDKFIDSHYMTVDANYNVTFNRLPTDGSQQSIRNQTEFPLEFRMVQNDDHGVNYKVYYIKLREGVNERPTAVDSIHVAYDGQSLYSKQEEILPSTTPKTYNYFIENTQSENNQYPVWFKTDDLVQGWSKIIPYFKTGTYDNTPSPNPVTFENYGAGIMFIPSGLGYYQTVQGVIPAYSNLVFSFKLYELRYRDHDGDGILSKDEVPIGSDFLYDPIDYDSDGDGTPNYFDVDDDDDRVLTKNEIKDLAGETIAFDLIPDCSGNTTNPTRVKKHLDTACH
jgi:FKBP-type peptidyl-prolyl cis-trans isomerase FkpA